MKDMAQEIVDGKAIQNLRRQFGMTPSQLARTTGLTEAQVNELEQGGCAQFQGMNHKIRCALKVASVLSGVQDNGLPRANVFNTAKPRRIMGDKPCRVAKPSPAWHQPRYQETSEFYKMLLLLFVLCFVLLAVVMPVLFGADAPPRIEKPGIYPS